MGHYRLYYISKLLYLIQVLKIKALVMFRLLKGFYFLLVLFIQRKYIRILYFLYISIDIVISSNIY